MFDAWKKIYYSGVKGDVVRIPCKENGKITDREAGLIRAVATKHPGRKDKNGMKPHDYFGLYPTEDKSESSYVSGHTAVATGNDTYRIKEEKKYYMEYFALRIDVGTTEEIAKNPKSNINRWLKAISFVPRGFWFWIMSIILSFAIVGIPLLVGCFIRLYFSFVAKSCLAKAKRKYKQEGRVVVF